MFFSGLLVGLLIGCMAYFAVIDPRNRAATNESDVMIDRSAQIIKKLVAELVIERGKNVRALATMARMERLLRIAPANTTTSMTWLDVFGFSSTEILTKEKVSTRYKSLAKIYHPDISGSDFAMQRLNSAKAMADKKFK